MEYYRQVIQIVKKKYRYVKDGAKEHSTLLAGYITVAILTAAYRIWLFMTYLPGKLLFLLSDLSLVLAIFFTYYVLHQFSNTGEEIKEATEARVAAERANKAKSRFLANMSHEIRTPINVILGMNEMIQRENKDASIAEYSESIDKAATNLLALVNDILDFSKIESGRTELTEGEYETGAMLNELEMMFRVKSEEKALSLRFEIDGRIPKVLYGDVMRVKQICMNLISNAIKYTDTGEVVFSVTWEREKDGSAIITITVTDTGRGIRKEDIGTLFDKFQRGDLKNNNTIEGTGLGLAITKSLVERMKGTISVESEYGKGSVFKASILQGVRNPEPLGDYRRWEPEKETVMDTEKTFRAPEARILAVDDTILNLKVLKSLLKRTGVQFDTAESGLRCLELAAEQHYDIILMDARMPHMDGVETFEELRNRKIIDSTTKVIALTANAMAGAKEMYLEKGFDGYLAKPVKPAELEEAIRMMLPKNMILSYEDKKEAAGVLPESLIAFPQLYTDIGMSMCGSAEIYADTLKDFSTHAPDGIKELKSTAIKGDYEAYTIKAHSLKSTSKLIGAMNLAELAKSLEQAGDSRDSGYIEAHTDEAIALYGEIADTIRRAYNLPKAEKREGMIEKEDVGSIFLHLKDYIYDFNYEATGSMLNAVGAFNFPDDSSQDKYDRLRSAYDRIDWAEMAMIVESE